MMFITQFHKLIRNKIVWGILLALIILVFVDWASSTAQRSSLFDVVINSIIRVFDPDYGRLTNAAATLDGHPITRQVYAEALTRAQLAVSLMIGRPIEMNARFAPMLERMAWKRLATLAEAQRLGLTATEQETDQALHAKPFFQEEGRFNPQRFQMFITEILPSLLTRQAHAVRDPHHQFKLFRDAVADELNISRMHAMLASAAWISPAELAQTFHQLHDSFLISYLTITPSDMPGIPHITEADARNYYDANSNAFRMPEQRRVRYVEFPISDYLDPDGIEKAVIENFYYANLDSFSRHDSNGVPLSVPIEYVEDEIRMQLAVEDAAQETVERARDFLDCLDPEGDNEPPAFDEVAVASGLTVHTTAFFTARSTPIDVPNADDDFTQAAFALGDASDGSASYPVPAGEVYCILSLAELKPAHIPAFNEVSEKALRLAQTEAEEHALMDYATAFCAKAERNLADGLTFDEIASSAGLVIQTTEPFTVTSGLDVESDHFQRMMQQAILHNQGELTQPIPTSDGLLIAFIEHREPGDPTTFEAIRVDLARYMRQRKSDMIFAQWQESLLSANRFINLMPATEPGDYEADDAADDADYF